MILYDCKTSISVLHIDHMQSLKSASKIDVAVYNILLLTPLVAEQKSIPSVFLKLQIKNFSSRLQIRR